MRDDDKSEIVWVIGTLLVTLIALLFAVLMFAAKASAEPVSAGLAYCSVYAREQARIDIMHTLPVTPAEAQGKYPVELAVRIFRECVSVLPTLLPLTPEHRSLDSWHDDVQVMIRARLAEMGVQPAADPPAEASAVAAPDDEEWRRQCAAEYSTWDPDTGTVVRRGSPERVRCPCMGEVQCVY